MIIEFVSPLPKEQSAKVNNISERLGVPITEIGKITNTRELTLFDHEGNKMVGIRL